jgi:3-dehydroquinate synthase
MDIKSYNGIYTVDFSDTVPHGKILLIDRNVLNLYESDFCNFEHKFIIDATEEDKTIHTVVKIIDHLLSIKFKKNDTIVVVGGGITQDISSMTAAIFKRGVKWLFVPTTLLSMCDSCIGSKSGLNHGKSKNQIGTFFPPCRVIINTKFLNTLSSQDIDSGIGEILKLYAIGNLPWKNISDDFEASIRNCLHIKKEIIERDEFENNIRAGLNYGHTFGHVFETMSDFKIPHGVAVIIGMYVVDSFFKQDVSKYTSYMPIIRKYIEFICVDDHQQIFDHLCQDKKVKGTSITLIKCDSGVTEFVDTPLDLNLIKQIVDVLLIIH